MGIAEVAGLLACGVCAAPVELRESRLECRAGHSFDVARSGYVNLSGQAAPQHADTAAMVVARSRFWNRGHYAPIAAAVVAAVPPAGAVLDCGAGPGHYLAGVLDAQPRAVGVALDISPAAARRAARAHPRLGSVVADAWRRLPVADGAVAAVLSVFAPRRARELRRVLDPDGRLITVTPTSEHLRQLRAELPLLEIGADKDARLAASLAEDFRPDGAVEVIVDQEWDAETVREAVAMGPSAFHLDQARLREALAALTWPRPVTVAVRVSRWRPRA